MARIACGDRLQPLVAGLVAEPVVDLLEAVEVEQDERQRVAGAADALQLAGEVLLEGAVVAQPGQRVGDRDAGARRATSARRARKMMNAKQASSSEADERTRT